MSETKKKIVLVAPALNEGQNLSLFFKEVTNTIDGLDRFAWEVIFVDDGSLDNTWDVIDNIVKQDKRVRGIHLSRNFGKEIALTAGMDSVEDADAVIFIDSDLQHPPELIAALISKWEEGFDIVSTQRESIEYSWIRKKGSKVFYKIMNLFSNIKILPNTTDFLLLDYSVLQVLQTFEERTRFFRGLVEWMGFKKAYIPFKAQSRGNGKSSFNLRELVKLSINSFTAFSLLPLWITGFLGLSVLSVTTLSLIYMFATELLGYEKYARMAYFVVFNTFLFGVVLGALGLIGLYIGHIHTEVVRRPLYIVQKRIGFGDE